MTKSACYVLLITMLLVSSAKASLVTNGNFEAGDTGFDTDYTFAVINTAQNEYTVDPDPSNFNNLFASFGDHTTGTGQMLVVNGSPSVSNRFWAQDISVVSGQRVDFSFWAANAFPVSPATVMLDVNGSLLSSFDLTNIGLGNWTRFDAAYLPSATGQVTFSMRNSNPVFFGNDFAIDDISAVSIPEPHAMALFGTTVLVIAGYRRRKSVRKSAG